MNSTKFYMYFLLVAFNILGSYRSLAKSQSASSPPDYQQFMKQLVNVYNKGDYATAKRKILEFEKQGGHPPPGGEAQACSVDELDQWKIMLECLSKSSYAAKSWDSIDQAQKAIVTTLRDGNASDLIAYVSCESLDLARKEIYCEFDEYIARPSSQDLLQLQSSIKKSGLQISNAKWESSPGPSHSKGASALKLAGFDSSNKPSFRATTKKDQGSKAVKVTVNDWILEVAVYHNGRVYISALPLIADHRL